MSAWETDMISKDARPYLRIVMIEKMIPENWKNLADAFAITFMAMFGLDKIVFENMSIFQYHSFFMVQANWVEISMQWFLWGSALCTFVWLFFRMIDTIVEKVNQVKKWFTKDNETS